VLALDTAWLTNLFDGVLPDCIEVSILGIPAAFYEALFPDHVIKYTHQFAS